MLAEINSISTWSPLYHPGTQTAKATRSMTIISESRLQMRTRRRGKCQYTSESSRIGRATFRATAKVPSGQLGIRYKPLSTKSRRELSACGNKENMRALLGYIKTKRRPKKSQPSRSRRSLPQQLERSPSRSGKCRQQHKMPTMERGGTSLDDMLAKMIIPQTV